MTHGGVEEHDGRTEEVLATATGRSTTFLAVGLVALGGAAWLLLVTGLGMAIGAVGTAVSFGGGALGVPRADPGGLGGRRASALVAWRRGAAGPSPAGSCSWPSSWSGRWPSCCSSRAGWPTSRRTPTCSKVPAESLAIGPELALTALASGRRRHGLVALPDARHRLASGSCGSPTPRGTPCPEARGPPPWGCGAPTAQGQALVVKRIGAPGAGRPARAQRPAPLRLLAPRGRCRDQRRRRRHARAARHAARRRRGRRGHHADPRVRRGRRAQRSLRRARDGPLRRRRPRAACLAGRRPAARPHDPGRAPRRLADPGPDDGRRRRGPALVATRDAAARARRAAAGAAARRPGGVRTCPAATATTSSPSTGARSATDPSAPTSGSSSRTPARRPSRCSTPT